MYISKYTGWVGDFITETLQPLAVNWRWFWGLILFESWRKWVFWPYHICFGHSSTFPETNLCHKIITSILNILYFLPIACLTFLACPAAYKSNIQTIKIILHIDIKF